MTHRRTWSSIPRARSALRFALLLIGVITWFAVAELSAVHAATRTWTGLGATTNWTDPGNWSGAAVPGAADVATFDATSAKNATLNAAVNVGGIVIGAGYAGIISHAGFSLTVGATGYSQAGGTFTGGTAGITMNGPFDLTGGSFASTAGTLSLAGAFTRIGGSVTPGAGTVAFTGGAATIDVGASVLTNVVVNASAKTLAAGTTLTATGTLTLTNGNLNGPGVLAAQGPITQASTFDGNSATLLINGTADQVFTGSASATTGDLPNVEIAKPSGTLTLAGTIRTSNTWTYTSGTLDPGTSTVVFAGGTVTGSHVLAGLEVRATTAIAAGTTLTATGTLTLTNGNLNGPGVLAAQGPITQASTFDGNSATLLINGTADQVFTGSASATTGDLPNVEIAKPSGTLTLAGTIRTSNTWTYTSGTLDPGTSTVVFAGGTVTGSHVLAGLEVRATTAIAAGTTLTATGTLTLTNGNLNGPGVLAAQGPITQASTFDGNSATLLINGTADQVFTGSASATTGDLPNVEIAKPSGTLTLAGTIRTSNTWTYTSGTLDPGTSTVVFAGGTVTGSHVLAGLEVRATTAIAAGTTLTATGTLTLTNGNLNGPGVLAAQGPITQASTFDGNSATLLINGTADQVFTGSASATTGDLPNVEIAKPSGTLTLAGTIRTSNTWTYTSGTLDPGTSTVVFAGGTVSSAGMAFYDVISRGGTTTLASAMTVGHDLTSMTGTFNTSAGSHAVTVDGRLVYDGTFRANGSTVTVRGDVTGSGSFVGGTSILVLDGTAGQVLGGPASMTLFDLIVLDPAGVALGADIVIDGTLTLTSGQLTVGAHRLTVSNPIGGTPTNLTADALSAITVAGSAAGITLPTSVMQLDGLTVANAAGLTIQGDLVVFGALTLTSGPVTTGLNTLQVGPAGTVTRTSGRVNGNLGKHVPAGAGVSLAYEIGDATRYTPVLVVFGTVTMAGELVAQTTTGEHPDIASSGVAQLRDVNRYWTLTNTGTAFDSYDATFTFVPTDVDAGASTASFIVAKLDGTTWTQPTVGTRTAVSTQAIGLTSFSDFVVGEPSADLVVGVTDGVATVTAGDGVTHAYVATVSNAGPMDATAVTFTATWPTGFAQGTITPSQGTCAAIGPGPDFSCDLGSIALAGSATVTVTYTVPASTGSGAQTISVTVASPESDPDLSTNTASDTTDVIEVASLTIAKDDGETSVMAGTGGHAYTITVTNSGPSDADAVVLDDDVPTELIAGVPAADLSGDCSTSSGNTISCTLTASLPPGTTWTVTIPYSVPAGASSGSVVNVVTVTSAENQSGVSAQDETDVEGVVSTPEPTVEPTAAPTQDPSPTGSPGPGSTAGPGSGGLPASDTSDGAIVAIAAATGTSALLVLFASAVAFWIMLRRRPDRPE